MTAPRSDRSRLMTALFMFVVFVVLTFLNGLREVGWKPSLLPLWFYGYCLLAGGVGIVGERLSSAAQPPRPHRQRVALLGFGWGLPIMAVLFSGKLLNGDARDPVVVLVFLVVWSVASMVYGRFAASARKSKWF